MSAPVLSSELQDFIGKLKCGSENIRDFDMMLASMCIEYREVMENELQEIGIKDGKVTVPVSNFEIVTLKFVL